MTILVFLCRYPSTEWSFWTQKLSPSQGSSFFTLYTHRILKRCDPHTKYLINCMSSHVLNYKTPVDTILTSFPNSHLVHHISLKFFGCSAFVHIHQQDRGKSEPRAIRCIFLGYSPNQLLLSRHKEVLHFNGRHIFWKWHILSHIFNSAEANTPALPQLESLETTLHISAPKPIPHQRHNQPLKVYTRRKHPEQIQHSLDSSLELISSENIQGQTDLHCNTPVIEHRITMIGL